MPPDPKKSFDLLVALAIFGLVFATWVGVLILTGVRRRARARRIEERIGLHEASDKPRKVLRLWLEDRVASTTVVAARKRTLGERLERLRSDAGWSAPAGTVISGLLGASLFLFVVPFALTRSVVPGLACAAALLLGAWFYLQHCIGRRAAAFERQFVDALDLAARSLRAGHPLLGAFRLISEEIPDPVGTVFMEICQQQALGLSLDEALEGVAANATNDDVRIFSTSVVIQLRSGGNLAHMMDRLAFVIRDRMRVSRKVRVLTAQTQLSKRLLLALPVVVFFAMHLVNEEYVRILYTTSTGQVILAIAVCGLVLGAWVMNRLCLLRY